MGAARGVRFRSAAGVSDSGIAGLAKRAVDSLVQAFWRPGFRVAPLIDADEPRVLFARNNLPEFASMVHSVPQMGHTTGTPGAGEIRFYRGLRGVLLMGRVSGRTKSDRD